MASGMNKEMVNIDQAYEVSVKDCEEKLVSLKDELNQGALSKEELSSALNLLKEENKVPRAEFWKKRMSPMSTMSRS